MPSPPAITPQSPPSPAPLAPAAPVPPAGWPRLRLSGRSVLLALTLGTLAAAVLSPIFITPFPVLLGRALFLSMVLLLAYAVGVQWPHERMPAWMPRWLVPVLAVAIAAPVATLLVYLLWVGGNIEALHSNPGAMLGFMWIAGTGSTLGLIVTFAALLRERDASARSQALQFALERSTLERQALDARLSLLHAQIEPHFLFNTLANVQALVESGSPRAPEVLKSLVAYLRAAMPRLHDTQAILGNEVSLVRSYLELMQMRMPDRLRFVIDIDPALHGERCLGMMLLTLVENAVRHGIDPSEDGGQIVVGARRDATGTLSLWVADSGVGLTNSVAPSHHTSATTSATTGTGLANLRSRLHVAYAGRARLELTEVQPHGLRAEIIIAREHTPPSSGM